MGMPQQEFVDYYEALQVSPSADVDTIQRIYRILAQRFHPDQRDTGDTDRFRDITEAYRVLSDPEKRAAYDVRHRQRRQVNWKIFDQSSAAPGVECEQRKREGILALLYRKRCAMPHQPQLTLRELEDLLAVPKEHLEFSLWYLKENHYLTRSDNAMYAITTKGVDAAEQFLRRSPIVTPLLAAPSTA